jgi:GNAT superfamily N-acetyltransferase
MTAIKGAWADLDARVEPATETFRADLDDADALVLLGELDGVPVGYAVARLVERLPQAGGLHTLVSEIYVDPEARAVGLGEVLIEEVLAWSSERGAKSAEIRVLPGHRSAKNFCEENGFTARLLLMHKNL